jgi:putative tryptophan/tyrosine transport system substrate-binding protein
MKRREFIGIVGVTAVTWPLAARAQQAAMPLIGMLQVGTPSGYDLSGFRQGLKDASYVEGQNLAIEYRFANDDSARLPELAADLVRRQVRVIATIASGLASRAAKDATDTIPIVFGHGVDPVKLGVVASLNRPGGNATGIISLANELYGKQLGILHELLPQAVHFAVLANPNGVLHQAIVKDTQAAAAAIGQTVDIRTPAPAARSTPPSRALAMKKARRACWSPTTHFILRNGFNWPSWRPAMRCLRSIRSVRWPKPVVC